MDWRLQGALARLRAATVKDVAVGVALCAVLMLIAWFFMSGPRIPYCFNPDSFAGTLCLDQPKAAAPGSGDGGGR